LWLLARHTSTRKSFTCLAKTAPGEYPTANNGTRPTANVLTTLARFAHYARLEPDCHRLQHFCVRVFGFLTLHYSISLTSSAQPRRNDSWQTSNSSHLASIQDINSSLASHEAGIPLYVMDN
jgi:hypothetical protein